MSTLPQLRAAMKAIAKLKGDFALFAICRRTDSRRQWDLVIAAPWLGLGDLNALRELVQLLDDQLGAREVREFGHIATLEATNPETLAELAGLNVDGAEKHLCNTILFGTELEEAVILRAKAPLVRAGALRRRTARRPSRRRKAGAKTKKRSAAARG